MQLELRKKLLNIPTKNVKHIIPSPPHERQHPMQRHTLREPSTGYSLLTNQPDACEGKLLN
jgi:hypothetical protein